MVTDDARITDDGACQLETWVHHDHAGNQFWALPACNPFGNLEITFGGALTHADGDTRFTDEQLQLKTLLRPLTTNDWGAGIAVGTVRHPDVPGAHRLLDDPYFYVPVSKSFADDRVFLHLNLGVSRESETDRTPMTWGLGSETQLIENLQLIAEIYGDTTTEDKNKPFYQLGLRFWVIPNLIQIDTTYGNQWNTGSSEHWLSLGLRITPPAFMK